MTLRSTFRPLAFALSIAVIAAFAGCDTSDPVPSVEPTEVAGTYDFTAFRFDPDRAGLLEVNLLDSLVTDETALQLVNTGDFRLRYRFEDEPFDDDVRGDFNVDRDEVVLRPRAEDRDLLPGLLIPETTLVLQRESETVLAFDETVTVDLEAFDEEAYGGFAPQPGRLTIRLQRRALDPVQAPRGN